jgi:NAD-dependent dihydropyrimidine dehydrogenase PreA subunit
MSEKKASSVDIFSLLSDTAKNEEEERKQRRKELLEPTGVKEVFKEGKIKINPYTCVGGQCKICIKACPTNALYWQNGQIGITEDLCVYCGACVVNCMVDDCIKVERKREGDGKTECFSKPADVVCVQQKVAAQKRASRVKTVFPTAERYLERYKP